jgi:hypothetical protein
VLGTKPAKDLVELVSEQSAQGSGAITPSFPMPPSARD